MESLGSFKEFEQVSLKTTYPIEVNGKTVEEGEIIAYFDKIQIAGLQQVSSHISANGGYGNRARVFWDTTKQINLNFTQGVFSPTHLALMTGSKLAKIEENEPIILTKIEEGETNEDGKYEIQFKPVGKFFCYRKKTGEKIDVYRLLGKQLITPEPYTDIVCQYDYEYLNGGSVLKIGQRLVTGFLELEGRTRVKDDTTGQITTGIIKIPKLKLMSDLSIRLGPQQSPVAATFSAVGIPVGSRNDSYVCDFYYLNNDIDSDL